MSFSFQYANDTFVRANAGNLGSQWTSIFDATDTGTLGITSNTARSQTGARAASLYNGTFANDQWAEVTASGTGTSGTQLVGVLVRGSSGGNFYFFELNMNDGGATWNMGRMVSGVFISMDSGTTGGGINTGCGIRLEVVGTTLKGYVNGNLVVTQTDSTFASGNPGVSGAYTNGTSTSSATAFLAGDMLWTNQGTVIAIGADGGTQEPTVIYDTDPVILTGNIQVLKMWYTNGWTATFNQNYAESTDGVNWTQYGSNPVMAGAVHGGVSKINGTYYAYMGNAAIANQSLDQWTSSNGVNWVKANVGVLSVGSAGDWDAEGIDNPFVWEENGTWYMLYTGANASNVYAIGLATSPDGVTWTKYGSNPIIQQGMGSAEVHKISGVYFVFCQASPTFGSAPNVPTDVYLFWAQSITGPWTAFTVNGNTSPIEIRRTNDEGANLDTAGQIADPSVLDINGETYMWVDATDQQSSGHIHITLRTSPNSLLSIMQAASGLNLEPELVYSGVMVRPQLQLGEVA